MGFAAISSIHVPACISLINDYFRHEDRSKANSVFVTAVSIGIGIANLTSIINKKIGWRNSSLCVSCTGLFVTFLIILIKEPRR
jgi:sugar phosphate permease